ncbi:peptide-N4-(N-acetyl-beta-glucosaminyl) asparagine amidase [Clonorchis sinensis]|uniref:Peptide-N(4)-(N-acetyl-beta-glucosaminyl)asparagine amidase n=1 Tax=Clonorchis sinensis TaxID=79923 RepID=G7YBA0_CLOSI|nr:peptide-N4-(N-acetyl-beta-glucosaminyl) asparagine amidase [Clonorchis sinensis]
MLRYFPGVLECLSFFGYLQRGDYIEPLPESAIDKDHVRIVLDQLKSFSQGIPRPVVQPQSSNQPQPQHSSFHQFLPPADQFSAITSYKIRVLRYLDPEAQSRANSLMPSNRLLELAARKAECTTERVKPRDFLHQLLRWFREEFFRWAEDFHCEICRAKMNLAEIASPWGSEIQGDAQMVEVFRCPSGHSVQRFPRYNDPVTLLETRFGRCGEWTNCFTLFLVSARRPPDVDGGRPWFPACRFISDMTDHVWCEIWLEDSDSGNYRWVHCDPSGEVDQPLLYECGWGKKLHYVFAYTIPPLCFKFADPQSLQAVDIQDVTWRYTRDFKEILSRRKHFPEGNLAAYLANIHLSAVAVWTMKGNLVPGDDVQNPFSMRQIIRELCSFLKPAEAPEHPLPGRRTGPLEWRRARGELGPGGVSAEPSWQGDNIVLEPSTEELKSGMFYLRYNSALDIYQRPFLNDGESTRTGQSSKNSDELIKHATEAGLFGWRSMASRWRNIDRKVEHDWKMVYLAREEGSPAQYEGIIEWKLRVPSEEYVIGKVSLFANLVSHSADSMAMFTLCSEFDTESSEPAASCSTATASTAPAEGICVPLSPGSDPLFSITNFHGCKQIALKGRLWTKVNSDGERNPVAWQQAQLFRQKHNDSGVWSLEWKVELVKKQSNPEEP